jgi:hypothetical protein
LSSITPNDQAIGHPAVGSAIRGDKHVHGKLDINRRRRNLAQRIALPGSPVPR